MSENTNGSQNGFAEDNGSPRARKKSVRRIFPSMPFEEALTIPLAIQKFASGHRILRLRLFEMLQRSPESGPSRALVTAASKYSLVSGSFTSEWLELTQEGRIATADDVPAREKIRMHFKLSIEEIPPFKKLYEQFTGSRLPVKNVMVDFLCEEDMPQDEASACVDVFVLNARFVGVLQTIAGAERLVSLDHVLDYAPSGTANSTSTSTSDDNINLTKPIYGTPTITIDTTNTEVLEESWDRICFYITPIGEDGSEQRKHSDLFLGSIIEPALEEFNLKVIRADKIISSGMISRQIIEHIIRSRLVIADLSFHNPNVFYELALRHAARLPTVHVIRAADRLPFDVNQVRTIIIDTTDIYALVPNLNSYKSAIASQVRRAIESPEAVDNPVTAFYPNFRAGS